MLYLCKENTTRLGLYIDTKIHVKLTCLRKIRIMYWVKMKLLVRQANQGNQTCLDMKTKIFEIFSNYVLCKNEMTGVAGRPRQPGRPTQGPGSTAAERQAGRLAGRKLAVAAWLY